MPEFAAPDMDKATPSNSASNLSGKKRRASSSVKKKKDPMKDEESPFKHTTDVKPPATKKITAKENKLLLHLAAMRNGFELSGRSTEGHGWTLRWSLHDAPGGPLLLTTVPLPNVVKLEDVLETLAAVLVRQFAMAEERGFWQGMGYTSRTGVSRTPQWVTFLDKSKTHGVRWEFEMDVGEAREATEQILQGIWDSVRAQAKHSFNALTRPVLPLEVAFKLALGLRAAKPIEDSETV